MNWLEVAVDVELEVDVCDVVATCVGIRDWLGVELCVAYCDCVGDGEIDPDFVDVNDRLTVWVRVAI